RSALAMCLPCHKPTTIAQCRDCWNLDRNLTIGINLYLTTNRVPLVIETLQADVYARLVVIISRYPGHHPATIVKRGDFWKKLVAKCMGVDQRLHPDRITFIVEALLVYASLVSILMARRPHHDPAAVS